MSPPRPLLMLAFEFPPQTAVGVHRSLKLARYLPEHGVTPVVVTTDGPSSKAWFASTLDESPLNELSRELAIHRVPCPRPPVPAGLWARRWRQMWSLGEDIGGRWEPHLTAVWDRLVAQSKPSAAYVTLPPFSVAGLAVKLARRSRLPLIVDFRDSWSQWCHGPRTSWLHYRLILRQERACLEAAWAVVCTTDQIVRDLQAVHPRVARDKFHVIPNGYDAALAPTSGRQNATSDPFVIGYVGSFYYLPQMRASVMEPWWRRPLRHWLQYSPRREDWLYRSPFFFLQAMKMMLDRRPDLRSRVRVRFVGDPADWLRDQVEHFGLEDVVEHLGRMPHQTCLEFEAGCDALLSTSAKVIGGRDFPIAGKSFEYVIAGRPVIAFVAEGEQKDFWQASGLASICDPDDPESSAQRLEQLVLGRFTPSPDMAFLRGFHRREASRQLAELVAKAS